MKIVLTDPEGILYTIDTDFIVQMTTHSITSPTKICLKSGEIFYCIENLHDIAAMIICSKEKNAN